MNKTLLNVRISWLFMVVVSLFLSACQGGGEENGTASVRLSFDLSSSKTGTAKTSSAPAPTDIRSIRIDVTGPEMEFISESVAVSPGVETVVNLEIPAGPARRFVVTAFDAEGAARFRGEATVDLAPGSSPSLTISMAPLDISVPPGPTPSIQISPRTAIVPKDSVQPFSVTGVDLSQVQWEVTSNVGNDPEQVGSVATDGDYTPPATILTDGATPIGNPIPITVTAVDINAPSVRDSATVTLTTGSRLTFEKNQRVTPSSGIISTISSGQRNIAFHSGKVYTVWADCPEGCFDILFSESLDGINWTEPVLVASNQSGLAEPSLAVGPDGSVYVAYVDCLFCSIETTVQLTVRPFGQIMFTPHPLTIVGTNPQNPTVAVSSQGVIFTAWSENRGNTGFDIVIQRINKDGNLLDRTPQNITINNGDFQQSQPVLATGTSGEIYLAWLDEGSLMATASLNAGDSFLPEVQVSDAEALRPSNPTLAAGPTGTVYIAWEDARRNVQLPSVFFDVGRINRGLLEFGADKPIGTATSGAEGQKRPSLAWDGTKGIYVAVEEILDGFDENGIFLAKSRDGGDTFVFSPIDDDPQIIPNKSAPSLVVDSAGRAFSIWTDGRLGGRLDGVFFAKGE